MENYEICLEKILYYYLLIIVLILLSYIIHKHKLDKKTYNSVNEGKTHPADFNIRTFIHTDTLRDSCFII